MTAGAPPQSAGLGRAAEGAAARGGGRAAGGGSESGSAVTGAWGGVDGGKTTVVGLHVTLKAHK